MVTARWLALARSRYATQVLAAALVGALVAVAVLLPRLQSAEVHLAALLLAFVMFPNAYVPPGTDAVYFTLTDGQVIGVEISLQSAAALLALPLLLATVAIVWLRPADAATVFGSMVTVICLAGAVLLFVFVFTGTRRRVLVTVSGGHE